MFRRIREQADDFFNASRILKESNEAALENLQKLAGKPLVSETAFGTFPTFSPSIVCLAFSVELYIKELYCALNMPLPRSHKILQLFQGLPPDVQQQIFAHDSISQNPFATRGTILSPKRLSAYDGFISQIEAISKAFEEWRYSYEHTTLRYDEGFALVFLEAVKSTTDNIRAQSAA